MEEKNHETNQSIAPELSVTDLINIKSILEVAVKRGAFNANELSGVGSVYDKLSKFLSMIPSKQSSPESETAQG